MISQALLPRGCVFTKEYNPVIGLLGGYKMIYYQIFCTAVDTVRGKRKLHE